MTLSSEIAALTGDEGAVTLIQIDARVSRLLNPPSKPTFNVPYYTTSLDPTLAEIRRRGWKFTGNTLDGKYVKSFVSVYEDGYGIEGVSRRPDDNLALAALEALVRAVEGQG